VDNQSATPQRSRARSGLLPDNDLDVLVQRGQERHQPLNGKPIQLIVSQRGDFWLVDAKLLCRRGLRQATSGNDIIDGMRQAQLRLPLFGIWVAKVGEHIARAAGDCLVRFVHCLSGSACHGGPGDPVARSSNASRPCRYRAALS